ncbi:MAG: type I restriction-modification system subunit M [Ktedonobacteraceae bacterium]|nr:type I restriction-modification system subunit M [Ktedonobacteraceae bacterium]
MRITQTSFFDEQAKKMISQDEINTILWKACDTFRGTVDPSEYKNYILVMLFLKYISDVWHDHQTKYSEQFGDDRERIQRRLSRERFVLPEGCDFESLYQQRRADNIGEIINIALDKIEDANREKLEGVFRNIDFNSESNLGKTKDRNTRLQHLLDDFANPRLDLRPSRIGNLDVIGNSYEYLIARFASGAGKKAGEFYTPPEVSELLASLLDPQPGERICDPACGSGSLLIKCARHVGSSNFSLFGQESNGSTWALAKMNMFLHGIDNARIEWGDTLRNPQLIESDHLMRFEVVVANPPFSLDKWGADVAPKDRFRRFHRGIPPKSKGDYAFIQHMIETTDSFKGRAGVIVPHGVLFRANSEGQIRRRLIEENVLDAVIGLPQNLFYGTGIPGAILVFRRNKPDDTVLFIDASHGFEAGNNQNKLRIIDVERIVNAYITRDTVNIYSYVATREEIIENDFNLNIPRYVDTFEEEEPVDIETIQLQIERLEENLLDVQQHIKQYLSQLS